MGIDSVALKLIKGLVRADPYHWDVGDFVEAYQVAFQNACAGGAETDDWQNCMQAIANIATVRFGRANWLEAIGAESPRG